MSYRHTAASILLFASAAQALAGDVHWHLPPPSAAVSDSGISRTLAPDYADEHVVDLLVRVQMHINASTVTERIRREIYFATIEGIQDDGALSIAWDSSAEELRILEAAVVDAAEEVHRFPPAKAKIIDRDSYDVFTDTRDVVLQMSGLEPGSVAVLEYERVVDRAQLPAHWMSLHYPRSSRARQRYEIEARWEGTRPYWRTDFDDFECVEELTTLRCAAGNLDATPLDPDVAYLDVLPQFLIGDVASWDEVIARVNRGIDSALEADSGVDEKFAELTNGATDADTMIERLHEFVSRDIRYASLSEGEHDIVPHAVSLTLKNRYGDCKDKSSLLLALLRRANVNAYPVLVATRRYDESRLAVPGTGFFDHMVVCVNRGGEFCFDPTDAYTDAAHTPAWIQGNVRLNLIPGAVPSRIPEAAHRWAFDVSSVVSFTSDGGQEERQTRRYIGEYAASRRSTLSPKTERERHRWALNDFQSTVSDLTEPRFEFTGLASPGPDLEIASTATYKNIVNPDNHLDYSEKTAWLNGLAKQMKSYNEHYDYAFAGLHVRSTYTFALNGLWRISGHGPELSMLSKYGHLTRTTRIEQDDKITFHTELRMPRQTVAQHEIERFNRFVDLVARETTMRVRGRRRK
ncbi:MAG: DUF3857 domain-containing protein [Gammaproteobacteria bacterium]